jgi:hypothetical protein
MPNAAGRCAKNCVLAGAPDPRRTWYGPLRCYRLTGWGSNAWNAGINNIFFLPSQYIRIHRFNLCCYIGPQIMLPNPVLRPFASPGSRGRVRNQEPQHFAPDQRRFPLEKEILLHRPVPDSPNVTARTHHPAAIASSSARESPSRSDGRTNNIALVRSSSNCASNVGTAVSICFDRTVGRRTRRIPLFRACRGVKYLRRCMVTS